jgi:hypothetical protein
MDEERKPQVWPWIVGIAVTCFVAIAIGAVCFFAVMWLARNNFGRPVSDRPATTEGSR